MRLSRFWLAFWITFFAQILALVLTYMGDIVISTILFVVSLFIIMPWGIWQYEDAQGAD